MRNLCPTAARYDSSVKRRLLTAIAVLSLIFAAATTALWVRSYWVWDVATHEQNSTGRIDVLAIWSARGRLLLFSLGWDDYVSGPRGWRRDRYPADDQFLRSHLPRAPAFAGFTFDHQRLGTTRNLLIGFPHWSLVTLCLGVAALRWLP